MKYSRSPYYEIPADVSASGWAVNEQVAHNICHRKTVKLKSDADRRDR